MVKNSHNYTTPSKVKIHPIQSHLKQVKIHQIESHLKQVKIHQIESHLKQVKIHPIESHLKRLKFIFLNHTSMVKIHLHLTQFIHTLHG